MSTPISLAQAEQEGYIYQKGAFWYIKGYSYVHTTSAELAYNYAAAHGLLPGTTAQPLGNRTAGQKQGSQNTLGAGVNANLTPPLTLGSPLITWLASVIPFATDQYLGWPILDWPLWIDLIIFALIGVMLYLEVKRK